MNSLTPPAPGSHWSHVALAIPDVKLIVSPRIGDARGFFSETWREGVLEEIVGKVRFVQDNHAHSAAPFTLRGLHFQIPPRAQSKLVRVTRGAIFDVAVDLRRGAPTYGRHVTTVLSRENWQQLWIPAGFAHGYCTLEPDTEVVYKLTDTYAPGHERGLRWDDPALGIEWPIESGRMILSERDRNWSDLGRQPDFFGADGGPATDDAR